MCSIIQQPSPPPLPSHLGARNPRQRCAPTPCPKPPDPPVRRIALFVCCMHANAHGPARKSSYTVRRRTDRDWTHVIGPTQSDRTDWTEPIGLNRLDRLDWTDSIEPTRLNRPDWTDPMGSTGLNRSDWANPIKTDQIEPTRLDQPDWTGISYRSGPAHRAGTGKLEGLYFMTKSFVFLI